MKDKDYYIKKPWNLGQSMLFYLLSMRLSLIPGPF
jgi:hypothetical protein